MGIDARLPDGTILRFPDGTQDSVIDRAVQEHLGSVRQPQAFSAPPPAGAPEPGRPPMEPRADLTGTVAPNQHAQTAGPLPPEQRSQSLVPPAADATRAAIAPTVATDIPGASERAMTRFDPSLQQQKVAPRAAGVADPDRNPPAPQDDWGTLARKALQNVGSMFEQQAGGAMMSQANAPFNPGGTMGNVFPGEQFGLQVAPEEAAARFEQSRPLNELGQRIYAEATAEMQANAPNLRDDSIKQYAYEIAVSGMNMAPTLAVGAVTRSPAMALSVMGQQVYGQSYAEAVARGASEGEARFEAAYRTTAEILPESLPLGVLYNRFGNGILTKLFLTPGAEGATEVLTEALNIGYDKGVLNEEMTWSEALDRMRHAGIVGLGMGEGMAIAQVGADALGNAVVRDGGGPTGNPPPPAAGPEQQPQQPQQPVRPPAPTRDDLQRVIEDERPLPEILRDNMPDVGQSVSATLKDGTVIQGTVVEHYEDPRSEDLTVPGVTIEAPDGTQVDVPMDGARFENAQVAPDVQAVEPSAEPPAGGAQRPPEAPLVSDESMAALKRRATAIVSAADANSTAIAERDFMEMARNIGMSDEQAGQMLDTLLEDPDVVKAGLSAPNNIQPDVVQYDVPAPGSQEAPQSAASQPAARSPISRTDLEQDTAVTPAGREVQVRYAVVEADDLVASQTDEGGRNPEFPQELQPRDRSRFSSAQQIDEIARGLNPRLVDRSPRASDGAPIVSPDGVVESGNGRILAIRRAYQQGFESAEAYRQFLADQGVDVSGYRNPVLVRVRESDLSPEERLAFTREANERDNMGQSATERAMSDASSLTDDLVSLYQGGDVDTARNRDFVRRFIEQVVPRNERTGMIARDGSMSQEAARRVEAALLARAYGDANLVSALIENADNNIRAIGKALTDVAGGWAKMRTDAAQGQIDAAMDTTEDLLAAVRIVDQARRAGRAVAEFVGQGDMLSGSAVSPMAGLYLRMFFRNTVKWTQPAGRERIAEDLTFYIDEANKTTGGENLFGERTQPQDIARLATERRNAPDQGQEDLLRPAQGDGEAVPQQGVERDGSEPGAGEQARRDDGGADGPQGEVVRFDFQTVTYAPDLKRGDIVEVASAPESDKVPAGTRMQIERTNGYFLDATVIDAQGNPKELKQFSINPNMEGHYVIRHTGGNRFDRPPSLEDRATPLSEAPETKDVEGGKFSDRTDRLIKDLGDVDPSTVEGMRVAAGFVLQRGTGTGNEYIVVLSSDNNSVSAGTVNERKYVVPSKAMDSAMRDPAGQYSIIHNHPSDSALSRPDIMQLGYPGLRMIAAIGHNGTVSAARLSDSFGPAYMALGGGVGTNSNSFKALWNVALGAFQQSMVAAYNGNRNAAADAAESVPGSLNDLILRVLHKAEVIDYTTSTTLVDNPHIRKGIEDAAKRVRQTVNEGFDAAGQPRPRADGKRAEPVRADAGMASVHALAQQPAAERPDSAGSEGTGSSGAQGAGGQFQLLDEPAAMRDAPLSEKRFYQRHSQHIDLRGRDAGSANETLQKVRKEGFKRQGPSTINTIPPSRGGEPRTIVDRQYQLKSGDVVYFPPNSALDRRGRIKDGWVPGPHEAAIVERDGQSAYDVYLSTFEADDPGVIREERETLRGTPEQERAINKAIEPVDKRNLIQRARDSIKMAVHATGASWRQAVADDLDSLARVGRQARGREDIPTRELSAYVAGRFARHAAGQVEAFLRFGQPRWNARESMVELKPDTEGFLDIVAPLYQSGKWRLFEGYAYARRVMTQGLIELDREKNLTEQEAEDLLNLSSEHPEFVEIFDKLQDYKKAFLDLAEGMGLINAQQRLIWERIDHVPFYRLADERRFPQASGGLANQTSGVRKLTGGPDRFLAIDPATGEVAARFETMPEATAFVKSSGNQNLVVEEGGLPIPGVIENIARNVSHLLAASMRNHAANLSIADALRAGVAERLPPAMRPQAVPRSEIRRTMREHGIDPTGMPTEGMESLWTVVRPIDNGMGDVVQINVRGKRQFYRIHDKLLFQSLTALHREDHHPIVHKAAQIRSVMTRGITTAPPFMARNFIRDSLSGWAQSEQRSLNLPKEMMESVKGIAKHVRGSVSARAIMAAGADTGWYQNQPEDVVKQLRKGLRDKKFGVIDLADPRRWFQFLEAMGRATEQANRIALHDAVIKHGGSRRDAAFEAMDLLDFQMRGANKLVLFFTTVVPFLNARIQGLYRIERSGRAGRGKRARNLFILKMSILATMATLNALINAGDDEEGGYNDLPEWQKDLYFVINVRRILGKDIQEEYDLPRMMFIPKPFEVGAITMTGPERMVQAIAGNDRGEDTLLSGLRILTDTFAFNPAGNPLSMFTIEQIANYNFFLDRPIVRQSLEARSPGRQSDATTSDTARVVGEAVDVSPERLEHFVRSFFGTIGTYVVAASDVVVRAVEGKELPGVRLDTVEGLRSFVGPMGGDPLLSTKWTERFYELKSEVETAASDLRSYKQEMRTERAEQFAAENERILSLKKPLDRISDGLSFYRSLSRSLYDYTTLSRDTQQDIMRAVTQMDNAPEEWSDWTTMDAGQRRDALNLIQQNYNELVRETEGFEQYLETGEVQE